MVYLKFLFRSGGTHHRSQTYLKRKSGIKWLPQHSIGNTHHRLETHLLVQLWPTILSVVVPEPGGITTDISSAATSSTPPVTFQKCSIDLKVLCIVRLLQQCFHRIEMSVFLSVYLFVLFKCSYYYHVEWQTFSTIYHLLLANYFNCLSITPISH